MHIKNIHAVAWMVFAAIVVGLDETIKFFALQNFPSESELQNPKIFELAIHKNYGVAFNIPFKLPIVIFFTVATILLLLYITKINWNKHADVSLSAMIIVIGALGNLYDRIMYGFTVDYMVLFGRSAINFSDIVIIVGVIMLLFTGKRIKHRLIKK